MPHPTRKLLPGAVLLASLLFLQGCGKSAEPEAAPAPPADPMVVTVKPEMAPNFEVRPLAMAEIATTQSVPGPPRLVLILASGSCRSLMRAALCCTYGSGTTRVSP